MVPILELPEVGEGVMQYIGTAITSTSITAAGQGRADCLRALHELGVSLITRVPGRSSPAHAPAPKAIPVSSPSYAGVHSHTVLPDEWR